MIRDPSDGSVKMPGADPDPAPPKPGSYSALKAKHGETWGIKQLERTPAKPFKAPTPAELAEHYATHNLAFKPKSETPLRDRSGQQGE